MKCLIDAHFGLQQKLALVLVADVTASTFEI
jgi:hypothetical protein